jgi:hypothetical protein
MKVVSRSDKIVCFASIMLLTGLFISVVTNPLTVSGYSTLADYTVGGVSYKGSSGSIDVTYGVSTDAIVGWSGTGTYTLEYEIGTTWYSLGTSSGASPYTWTFTPLDTWVALRLSASADPSLSSPQSL